MLAGLQALVLEDNALIAMDVEAQLRAMGASDVAMATTAHEALVLIGAGRIDIALLDVELGEGTSESVAAALASLGAPFAFTTGYGEPDEMTQKYPEAPLLEKPFDRKALRTVVAALTRRRAPGAP